MDFIDLYKAFHSNAAEYILFYRTHGTFSSMYHVLGLKTSLNKLKKLKLIKLLFLSQWYETRNQLQEESWKKICGDWMAHYWTTIGLMKK